MSAGKKVDAYIENRVKWKEELQTIRTVFHRTELVEEIKWGAPTYTLNNKLVAGIAAFKNHYAIWFHQGAFLKDHKKQLVNAQEGVTRGLRQWRFEEGDIIDPELILSYLLESIENCLAGKEIKPQRKKGVVLPPLLSAAIKNSSKFSEAFTKLTPGKQREYASYIAEAKRAETKKSRLDKITPMILLGVGLNHKYKNC